MASSGCRPRSQNLPVEGLTVMCAHRALVSQLVEHRVVDPGRAGSSPVQRALAIRPEGDDTSLKTSHRGAPEGRERGRSVTPLASA